MTGTKTDKVGDLRTTSAEHGCLEDERPDNAAFTPRSVPVTFSLRY